MCPHKEDRFYTSLRSFVCFLPMTWTSQSGFCSGKVFRLRHSLLLLPHTSWNGKFYLCVDVMRHFFTNMLLEIDYIEFNWNTISGLIGFFPFLRLSPFKKLNLFELIFHFFPFFTVLIMDIFMHITVHNMNTKNKLCAPMT